MFAGSATGHRIAWALILLGLAIPAPAEAEAPGGQEFWTSLIATSFRHSVAVVNPSPVSSANVTFTSEGGSIVETATIPPLGVERRIFEPVGSYPVAPPRRGLIATATFSDWAVRITSDRPVVAYGGGRDTTPDVRDDTAMLLPRRMLGTRHVLSTWENEQAPPAVFILGTEPGATAYRVLDLDGSVLDSGELAQFDTRTVQFARGERLDGVRVESSRPTAVFAGNFTYIGNACCGDFVVEQAWPPTLLGRDHVVANWGHFPVGEPVSAHDAFHVVATADGTLVETEPDVGGGLLQAGERLRFATNRNFVLRASEPVSLAQFTVSHLTTVVLGVETRAPDHGDPSVVFVPSIDHYQTEHALFVHDLDDYTGALGFIDVIQPEDAMVELDGALLTGDCDPVGTLRGERWCVRRTEVGSGAHFVRASRPVAARMHAAVSQGAEAVPALLKSVLRGCSEPTKITATAPEPAAEFGRAVAITSGTALVGAPRSDADGPPTGAALVFESQPNGRWIETAVLLPADVVPGDRSGTAVAIEGDRALTGSPFDDDGAADSGSAHVFERGAGGDWFEVAVLRPADARPGARFGAALELDGDRAIVAAEGHDESGADSGAAYVFDRDPVASAWSEAARLMPSLLFPGDRFGADVDVDGERALCGAPGAGLRDAFSAEGAAHLFERQPGGDWLELARLGASDGATGDELGAAVALEGERLVLGAPGADGPVSASGAAYVFERDAGGSWVEVAKLVAWDGARGDRFGQAVALSGDRILVGASSHEHAAVPSGAAYLFERDAAGLWREVQEHLPLPGAASGAIGASAALCPVAGIVGAPEDDEHGTSAGAAHLLVCSGNAGPCAPDSQPPVASCRDLVVPLDADGRAVIEPWDVDDGSFDDCGEVSLFASPSVVSCADLGELPVTLTVTDESGASSSCVAHATVLDVTPPVLDCAPDAIVECGDDTTPAATGRALATDACDDAPLVTFVDVERVDPACPSVRVIERTWTATDASGNAASCLQVIDVQDTTPPTVTRSAADDRCLWAPNHELRCFDRSDFAPIVQDLCGASSWSLLGCESSQPDEAPAGGLPNGDGHFADDCTVTAEGGRVCVRAERAGQGRGPRTYTVRIRAVDECGNAAEADIATLTVHHDRRAQQDCLRSR